MRRVDDSGLVRAAEQRVAGYPRGVEPDAGDPGRLTAALDAEYGVQVFRQYAQTYGLGYQVQARRTVSVPGHAAALRLDKAQEVAR